MKCIFSIVHIHDTLLPVTWTQSPSTKRVLVESASSNPKLTFVFSYVVVMPKKRQALVEYEDMNGSSTAVTYAADNQVYIAGHPAFINYSTSQKISRPGDSDDSRSVNNVLLLTIMNPIYPITTVNAMTYVMSFYLTCGGSLPFMTIGFSAHRLVETVNLFDSGYAVLKRFGML